MKVLGLAVIATIAAGLAGCSISTASFHDPSSAFGSVVGSVGTPPPDAVPAPPPSMGAFLEGPVGLKLVDADRQTAFQAEQDALASGDRKTWRGAKGIYGFVAPASAAVTPNGCRDFTHTIYIGGRPQAGKGTGCKGPDGAWRVTG